MTRTTLMPVEWHAVDHLTGPLLLAYLFYLDDLAANAPFLNN